MHPLVDVKHVLSCPSLCHLSVVLCISECCAELYNPRVMTSQTEGALSFLKRKGCAILLRASDYKALYTHKTQCSRVHTLLYDAWPAYSFV